MLLGYLYGIPPHVDETVLPEMSVFIKLTFGPVHRTAWTIVLSWLIFACARGYAGTSFSRNVSLIDCHNFFSFQVLLIGFYPIKDFDRLVD